MRINVVTILVFFCSFYNVQGQVLRDLKIKLSAGFYGLSAPSEKYIESYQYGASLNYSFGLVKNFKLNSNGSWLLGTEVLYNRTNIKIGVRDEKDHFKMDQLLLPIKLIYHKSNFMAFIGLVNNVNFATQLKIYGNDYFNPVGTFNYDEENGTGLFRNDFIDNTLSLQYCLGMEYSIAKGPSIGLEFVDYFGYRYYYTKYFDSSYSSKQISSSALNFYVNFNINKSE